MESSMKILIFFIFLISSSNIFAAENQYGEWFGTFTKKSLSERLSFWSETQLRYSYSDGAMAQVLVRMGILDQINPTHELGYLYGFIQSGSSKEHRLALQHSMTYLSSGDSKLSHRIRLEARFIEDIPSDASRFRYLLRFQKNNFLSDFNGVFWNELFINTQNVSWNGNQSFDRNRLFLGLNKKIGETKYEFGYLNQYVERDTSEVAEHLVVLYMFF